MKLTRVLGWLFSVIIMLAVLAFIGFYFLKDSLEGRGTHQEDVLVEIPKGTSLNGAVVILQEAGVIENGELLKLSFYSAGVENDIKYGEYEIPAKASITEIRDILVSGDAVQLFFTVPEGLTSWEIVQRLNAASDLSGEITEIPPEGSLAPNSYAYLRNDDRQNLIDQMHIKQIEILDAAWANRDEGLPLKSKEELLILASIVEKETGLPAERGLVASVFINRLNEGMRLQTDPTVIYGITNGEGPLGRGLRRSELQKETPYNTYVIDGLPPTPIANPGAAAIHATANPDKSDYFYFVADGTGGHAFAKTLNEHNENVKKWREIERAQ